MPRRYPPEFRRKVLALFKAGRSVAELVRDLEIFHNRQRHHSSLGMLTPIEYERIHPITLSVA
ncbi:hypothetical protein [Polymorphospora rubra]|uniref:Transposase n=1 Tax=Polymorphospora rubra TaxID=338584 RepID=A0A810N2G8_9ACTN|nr:hypothetical protein Prubr_27560 [Polymorphospora rubra]